MRAHLPHLDEAFQLTFERRQVPVVFVARYRVTTEVVTDHYVVRGITDAGLPREHRHGDHLIMPVGSRRPMRRFAQSAIAIPFVVVTIPRILIAPFLDICQYV